MALKKKKLINLTISVLLTGLCFLGLIIVQSKISYPEGTTNVVIAKTKIDKGTVITRENLNSLFKTKDNVDKSVVPDTAIENKNSLIGMIATNEFNTNEIIKENEVKSKNDVLIRVVTPREISIDLKSIGSSVGGELREGDIVDIFVGNNELKESTEVLKNVYINSAMTSDGTKIERGQNGTTTIINVILDQNDVNKLTTAMQQGDLKVTKVN